MVNAGTLGRPKMARRRAAASGGLQPLAGYDWKTYLSTRTLFEGDWVPDGGHQGYGSNSAWETNGTGDVAFYPYTFNTDGTVPGGEYVRLFCDKVGLHPADNNHGYGWFASSAASKRAWTGGYLEFCARFPSAGAGKGMFPAPAWIYACPGNATVTDNTGTFTQVVASNATAEIDFCEVFGDPFNWHATSHPGGANNQFYDGTATPDEWHTWGLDWNPGAGKIDLYYDRVLVANRAADAASYVNQPLQARFDIDVFVGTGWWNPANVVNGATPASLYIDVAWVRHYAALPSFTAGTPKIGTLVDNTASANTTIWAYGAGCSVAAGVMHVVCNATFKQNVTVAMWDLTSSAIYTKVVAATGGVAPVTVLQVDDNLGAGNGLRIECGGGNLLFKNTIGYASDGGTVSIVYVAGTHAYWRIRQDTTSTYWDTSPDGATWTNQRVMASQPTYSSAGRVVLSTYNTSGVSTDALFSNINS